MTDIGLKVLVHNTAKTFQTLTALRISCTKNITSEVVELFGNLPHLDILDITRCVGITDHALLACTQISSLSICGFLAVDTLALTQTLTQLKSLSILSTVNGAKEINEGHFTKLNQLESLTLLDHTLSDQGLSYISLITNLTCLDLSYNDGLYSSSIEHISHLRQLKTLVLANSTHLGYHKLKQHPPSSPPARIKHINSYEPHPQVFTTFKKLKHLQLVCIDNSELSDEALQILRENVYSNNVNICCQHELTQPSEKRAHYGYIWERLCDAS